MKTFQLRSLFACWLTAALLAPVCLAQATLTRALLQGTVHDPSGAPVAGAGVTMKNDATGISQQAKTDNEGRYLFGDLQPASYTLRVEATGFRAVSRPNVVLRVGQETDLEFHLQVGDVATTVEVTDAAPLLNSADAALGQVIDNRQITQLPILNRQVLNLAFLVPGVVETGDTLFGGPGVGPTGINFTSNGQRNSSSDVLLDGAVIAPPEAGQGSGQNNLAYSPSPDAVNEFKIQNNSFSAEYGSNGGSVVNIISKSGGNQFHGSAYYFGRRPIFDAEDFYSNLAGNPKPDYSRDQYGGSLGGPIIRQRTFFFFDYDRIRLQNASIVNLTVPTALQRAGNFSQTYNQDGSPMQIYNPFSVHPVTDSSGAIVDYQRSPFPGNVILPSQMDPVAAKIVDLYPQPTGPGLPVTGFNNFTKTELSNQPAWQFDIRVDHSFSDKSHLFGRFSRHDDTVRLANNIYGNAANIDQGTSTDRINNAIVEETYSFNAGTVLTVYGALNRVYSVRNSDPFDPTSVGWSPTLLQGGFKVFPTVNVGNYASLGGQNCVDTIANTTLPQYGGALNKVHGPHNMKFGTEQRLFYDNFTQPCTPTGQFGFSNSPTAQSVFNPNGGGNALASFLLGTVDGGSLAIQPGMPTKSKETAFYFQDDWRVTSRLTVNLGLRYEWSTPYSDRFNRIQIANFHEDSGASVPGVGEIIGVTDFARLGHHMGSDLNNFAPRAGLAFRITQNTVLRGGAGVYYNNNPATNNYLTGPSSRSNTPVYGSLDGGITRFASLANPFPNGLIAPQGTAFGKLAQWGLTADAQTEYQFRNGEIYQWNGGVQHQFKGNMLVEVDYSGSRGTHLPLANAQNRNFVSAATREQYGSVGLNQQVNNPFYSLFQGPNAKFNLPPSIYNSPTISLIDLLRPYPQFPGGFSGWISGPPEGNSKYNALQIRVEKRYSYGLNFQGSYTFSKEMDDGPGSNTWLGGFSGGPQDLGNLRGEWSVGSSDTPHRLVFSGGYELPFGRGKRFGNHINRVVDAVAGGWQLNGILSLQSGAPLHVYMANGRLADGSQRPDITGNPRRHYSIKDIVQGKGTFFNTSAFSDPGDQVPGSAPRYDGSLRGDGIRNLDASLFKNFKFTEQKSLEVRGEFFNFFNTPRFANPDLGFGDQAFGQIFGQYNTARRTQLGARFVF